MTNRAEQKLGLGLLARDERRREMKLFSKLCTLMLSGMASGLCAICTVQPKSGHNSGSRCCPPSQI